jgi:hypothetical protein
VTLLERRLPFAAFVQGALGGVDVLFPRDGNVTAEDNLRRMAEPMAVRALELFEACQPTPVSVRTAAREWPLPPADARPFYDDQVWARRLDAPLRWLLNALFSQVGAGRGRVQGLRLGDFALVGTPADLGVSIDLAGKAHARSRGIPHPVIASQCDGYLGYLHLPADYARLPTGGDAERLKEARRMGTYENWMCPFGHGSGSVVLDQARLAIDALAA